ncbi:MAG: hypothetical protein FWF41_06770 [Betaproteobacteria bacterium]|nr:hypothetical protein [Betaproteobacteria bacterium]
MVELMTVIAILVLSLLLAAPSISGYLDERKVKNVAESLYYGMQKAKAVAVNTNDPTELTWTGQGWTIWRIDTVAAAASPGATTHKTDDPTAAVQPKSVEVFNWGSGGDNDWSSVTVTTVPASGQATVTFTGGDGHLEFPNPDGSSQPNIQPPNRFVVTGRLASSRPMWVTVGVGGGVRVCDPQLPPSDPKGCVCNTSPTGCG